MKPGEVQTYLPPPPHKIVDYLNGSIIGHNVMKKAISVAIYNHFCNINFSRYEPLCKSHLFFHKASNVEFKSSNFKIHVLLGILISFI